jgi:hypothetical protein
MTSETRSPISTTAALTSVVPTTITTIGFVSGFAPRPSSLGVQALRTKVPPWRRRTPPVTGLRGGFSREWMHRKIPPDPEKLPPAGLWRVRRLAPPTRPEETSIDVHAGP